MIIDCYTHIWDEESQLGRCQPDKRERSPFPNRVVNVAEALPSAHRAAREPVDHSIVVGFKTNYLEAELPNELISKYVESDPKSLIGFVGLDPSDPKQATDELRQARDEWGFRGVAVAPAAQDFHPSNSQAMMVYAEAAARNMPILFHTGIYLARETKLEYARPVLLDEVARELPDLKIVIAHMGFPWVSETTTLLSKHENVFAETSWVLDYPWQAYHALISAYEFGVMDKLFFGSGFPFGSAVNAIEGLYSINHVSHGTNLPSIPRECLRGIVERDSLSALGIGTASSQTEPEDITSHSTSRNGH
ncbi:MAG: amidohydrolase family protein [Planctomycetota bacterium]